MVSSQAVNLLSKTAFSDTYEPHTHNSKGMKPIRTKGLKEICEQYVYKATAGSEATWISH